LLAGAAVVVTAALVVAACTSHTVDPDRAGTVIVAVSSPFTSLNAGLPEGRTAGSTLVRGLAQDGLVALDDSGAPVPDPAFGSVEKISDSPLTVRYTLAAKARWSDGVAVSPADLLLEWAARSGRFDEAAAGDGAAAAPTPTPTAADAAVRFGAASAAVLQASATPTLDEHGITVVYDHPVADWQVALDIDLPAHVVGKLALLGAPTPGASAPAPQPTGSRWSDDDWAQAVAKAIVTNDHDPLARISAAWRTGFDATALASDPSRAVTTGPYRIESVDPTGGVTLVRSASYAGARPATRDRIIVRWNLDPLAAIDGLRQGDVDVVAPVVTPDVVGALGKVPDVRVTAGGGAVLQLQLNEAEGPFSASGAGSEDAAARARAAFVGAVPADAIAAAAGAEPSNAVLATVGPARTTTPVASSGTTTAGPTPTAPAPTGGSTTTAPPAGPMEVRVLVTQGDPVRAAMLDALTGAVAPYGFTVTAAEPANPATALWQDPGSWDAAIVPVTQAELPVVGVTDMWRSGGATNVTGHADPALDALLDKLGGTTDTAAAGSLLDQVDVAVRQAQVVLPLARQPSLTATITRDAGSGLPDVGTLPAVPWGSADLSAWWSWATQPG
jgi:peptide/nickel transport system substrate-binding protein